MGPTGGLCARRPPCSVTDDRFSKEDVLLALTSSREDMLRTVTAAHEEIDAMMSRAVEP